VWRAANARVERVRLEYVFVVIALVWGVAQVFIVPPLQVPDEGDHWFRAWAMTDGQLTSDAQRSLTLPGTFARTVDLYTSLVSDTTVLPKSLDGQAGFTGYEDLFNGPASPDRISVTSRVSSYGPMGYLPQATGIGLGRLLGASPLACFYLARLANLLAAIAFLFLAIRLAPFGKQLFVLLALLPMTMFELASVSCDALTIAGAMFFTSLLLWASQRPTLRGVDAAVVVASAAILLNIKPGYGALVLLVLLLRPVQLGGRARFGAFVAASVFAVVGVFLIDYLATGAADRAQVSSGAREQLAFVLTQPLAFLGVLWSSLGDHLVAWTLQTIGVLGWFTIGLPAALYLFVILGGVAFYFGMPETVGLQVWQRFLLAAVGLAVFITVAVALYVFLPTPDGEISMQGRYLAPVLLPLLLAGYGIRFARWRLDALSLVAVLVVIMVVNLQALASAYGA
jgi:uncharacterized membrane protein